MTQPRLIARLDIKGPNLVKGIHLEGLRVLGKPWDFARYYYEQGADELIFQDAVASLYGRNCLHDIIEKTAREIFIPLTVGGGLRCIEDIAQVLRRGADKVSLNTAAIRQPMLIKEAVERFGSSSIVVAIEAIKQKSGDYFAFINNGREPTGIEVVSWAKQAVSLGAGEILLTSVDQEGTGLGFDMNLIKAVAGVVDVPIIAHGGPSRIDHVAEAFAKGGVDAVALASMLHYGFISNVQAVNAFDFKEEGNIEFIKKARPFKNFGVQQIPTIKKGLQERGIMCRMVEVG